MQYLRSYPPQCSVGADGGKAIEHKSSGLTSLDWLKEIARRDRDLFVDALVMSMIMKWEDVLLLEFQVEREINRLLLASIDVEKRRGRERTAQRLHALDRSFRFVCKKLLRIAAFSVKAEIFPPRTLAVQYRRLMRGFERPDRYELRACLSSFLVKSVSIPGYKVCPICWKLFRARAAEYCRECRKKRRNKDWNQAIKNMTARREGSLPSVQSAREEEIGNCKQCRERKGLNVPAVHLVNGEPMCQGCFSA